MPVQAWAQASYLALFSKIASTRLKRTPRVEYGSAVDNSIRVIGRYQRSGGITNGALHNLAALRAANYAAEPVDVSDAIRNPASSRILSARRRLGLPL